MKKKYLTPDMEVISLISQDVLAASTYSAVPEDPTRAGQDFPTEEF